MLLDVFFAIDDLLFPWGTSLLEVATRPPGNTWQRDEGDWPNLRGSCRSAFGLATTACNLRAPEFHKPVLHLDYTLAPAPPLLNGADTVAHWLRPLTQLLGPPTEAAPATPPRPERGSLLFRATWQRTGHHISLKIYGALHPESDGYPTATLALEWQDLLSAAQPFLASIKYQEDLLTAAFQVQPELHLMDLQEVQHGCDFTPKTIPPIPEALFQQAKRALYSTGLYKTPAQLHAQLNQQQVALWDVIGDYDLALSTKWTTVLLPGRRGPGPQIELVTTRPAKGGGFMSLHVGQLVLYDKYQSPLLQQLAGELERRGFATVIHSESSDC